MSRTDQWIISVSVRDASGKFVKIPDPFDKFDGGDVDSSESKYRPGAMEEERALGGTRTVSNVTVGRLYDYNRDHDLARRLADRAGRADMRIAKRPLDADGVPFGEAHLYTGILKSVNFPKVDSNGNGANVFELVCSTHGRIS